MYTKLFVKLFPYYKLPERCRGCELLGICRRKRDEAWKCYNGCMLMTNKESGDA